MKRRANDKSQLPTKLCATCGRPFAWRRKWAQNWPEVRYCSERCRRGRSQVRGEPKRGTTGQAARCLT